MALLDWIERPATGTGMGQEAFEVRMLYGIRAVDRPAGRQRLPRVRTLIAFGTVETAS
jgi:hypothetical protein